MRSPQTPCAAGGGQGLDPGLLSTYTVAFGACTKPVETLGFLFALYTSRGPPPKRVSFSDEGQAGGECEYKSGSVWYVSGMERGKFGNVARA
eukprot:4920938-Prymnesium_polylepis.1